MSQADLARCGEGSLMQNQTPRQPIYFVYNKCNYSEISMIHGEDVTNMLINPYYAVNIAPDLALEHDPIASEADWVRANIRLMDEIGAQEWLERLLAVLQGESPHIP
jgi:hypothetical protein